MKTQQPVKVSVNEYLSQGYLSLYSRLQAQPVGSDMPWQKQDQ